MNDVSRRNVLKLGAATGLAGIVSGPVLGAVQQRADQKPDDKWRAWAVTQGEHSRLVVEGVYREGGPGTVALVKEAKPQGTNPKILQLKLQTATLPGIWPAVLQPIPAYYIKTPYKAGQYNAVRIAYPNGETISIDQITETKTGPEIVR